MKNIIRNIARKILPDREFTILDYFTSFKRFPSLRNPQSINEKILWLKLYGGFEKYSRYVDKLMVRDFVAKRIGNKNLIPLLGSWDKFDDIPFEKLPQKFVLKATHGSGYVFVCKDKSKLNLNELNIIVDAWMRESFYEKTREIQYKNCKPKLICEKYLEDNSGGLVDYKIYCSNGIPKFLEIHFDRFVGHKVYFTDTNYKRLPITSPDAITPKKIVKPKNIENLLATAEKLAKGFLFVRVDLYSVNNKIYFGELTFSPAGGHIILHEKEAYRLLGEMIDLRPKKINK